MKMGRSLFALPLLAKELIELAARRRTYVLRVVYALLLYLIFAWLMELTSRTWSRYPPQMWLLGSGERLFSILTLLQLAGIYLFLPALAAGQITQEKERDSLVLLLLTELSPWQILLQKYASALISIFSFLLIGLPLAALAYSFGGVSPLMLLTGVYVLVLTCLQVAAFALLCSTFFRTTVAAFLATYVGGFGLYYGLYLIGMFLDQQARSWGEYTYRCVLVFSSTLLHYSEDALPVVLLRSLPALGLTALFLLLARFYFVRRAFAPPTNRLLALFRRIDTFMQNANRRLGGVTFRAKNRALPQDDPIAWREQTRRSLGRPEYLVRVLLAGEVIAFLACLLGAAQDGWSQETPTLTAVVAVLGSFAVLTLSALAANGFVSERLNQTLEVLLTTPLTAQQMVRQKARTLSRLMWVLAVPLMTVFAFEAWSEGVWTSWSLHQPGSRSTLLYLVGAALTLLVYLPLVLWLSSWVGLKMRTRFRAILTALGVIVGWCVLPLVLAAALNLDPTHADEELLFLFSPLTFPSLNETNALQDARLVSPWAVLLLNFAFYGSLALLFRQRCLRHADRYLRG